MQNQQNATFSAKNNPQVLVRNLHIEMATQECMKITTALRTQKGNQRAKSS